MNDFSKIEFSSEAKIAILKKEVERLRESKENTFKLMHSYRMALDEIRLITIGESNQSNKDMLRVINEVACKALQRGV